MTRTRLLTLVLSPLLLSLLSLLLPAAAQARAWNNITPGVSSRGEVLQKFGEPSRKVPGSEGEIMAYSGARAIRGTRESQFTIGAGGKVEQIVVFPATTVEVGEVEDSYGRACSEVEKAGRSAADCFHRQLTDDFRTVYWYKRAGLMVFLAEDKKTVASIRFMPAAGVPAPASAVPPPAAAGPRTDRPAP